MLVKHFLRRHNDDAMVPVDTHVIVFFAFIPKQGIAAAVDGKDVGAARMAMRLLLVPDTIWDVWQPSVPSERIQRRLDELLPRAAHLLSSKLVMSATKLVSH